MVVFREEMMRIEESGAVVGARVEGVDLARLAEGEFDALAEAFARYSVLAVGGQKLEPRSLFAFSSRLGTVYENPTSAFKVEGLPEVMILSNKRENGKLIGIADAGEGWHTDMSYNEVPGKATVLYGIEVPHRDGRPLGDTLFSSMYAVYEALPADLRQRIEGLAAEHDFAKFYDRMIREKGSERPPLTPEQRAKRPPVIHPIVGVHPRTRRKFLYADPGYTTRIIGLDPAESDRVLETLFAMQTRDEFIFRHKWRAGDVLIWDNWATIHMATGGYEPHEHRYMLRAQVVGNEFLAA
jgi:taurine dioxygenase